MPIKNLSKGYDIRFCLSTLKETQHTLEVCVASPPKTLYAQQFVTHDEAEAKTQYTLAMSRDIAPFDVYQLTPTAHNGRAIQTEEVVKVL